MITSGGFFSLCRRCASVAAATAFYMVPILAVAVWVVFDLSIDFGWSAGR